MIRQMVTAKAEILVDIVLKQCADFEEKIC